MQEAHAHFSPSKVGMAAAEVEVKGGSRHSARGGLRGRLVRPNGPPKSTTTEAADGRECDKCRKEAGKSRRVSMLMEENAESAKRQTPRPSKEQARVERRGGRGGSGEGELAEPCT
jgi:hypothetical protein